VKVFSRKESVFLLVLFLLALSLRLVYLNQLRSSPLFDTPITDAKYHDEWAQAIRDGRSLHEGPYFRAPLYGYFLALIYTIFGHSYLAARLIQFLLGSLSVVLIYFLGRRIFGPLVGRVAAIMAAVYGTFIYFEGELLIPVLIIFLDLVLMLALLSVVERPGWWRWLGCGAILGLSAVARPNVLLFGVVLIPWLLVSLRRRGLGLRRSFIHLVGFSLGIVLMILPVTVRNYMVGKDFVPIASQGGVNFFIGNNRDADGITVFIKGTDRSLWGVYFETIQLAEQVEGRSLRASEVSNYWFRRGLEFIRDEPGASLRLLLRKLTLFWSGPEISNNKGIYFFSKKAPLLGMLIRPGPLYCPFGVLAPLALAGMVLAWRRGERKSGLMVLFIFSYMVSIILFFVTARYRLPIVPFLLPFAAYSLVRLFQERTFAQRGLLVGLILIFGLVVNLNLAGYELLSPVECHTTLGNVYMRKGMYNQAEVEFQRALSINPRYIHPITGLARVYDQTNKVDMAIEQWEKAISLNPREAQLHFSLGFSYYAKGRLDDAIAQWTETAQLQPGHPGPYLQLGVAYEDKGQYDQAIAALQQAIEVNPQYVIARYNLGLLYKKMGRTGEAVEQFQRVIEVDETFGDAYNSLAWLYSQEGVNLDEGIALIKKALELDESQGAYWDTLAELYIKKGQVDRAREIFRRMIEREPEEPFWRERLAQLSD
jgi:pentatricopeptide repeat protein